VRRVRPLRRARDRRLRRRAVRARARPRADPVPGVAGFHRAPPPAGLPSSPMPPVPSATGFRWGEG
jgi:hypothetical protein